MVTDEVIKVLELALLVECPICYEKLPSKSYYKCSHLICSSCHQLCIISGHRTCAICRANEQI